MLKSAFLPWMSQTCEFHSFFQFLGLLCNFFYRYWPFSDQAHKQRWDNSLSSGRGCYIRLSDKQQPFKHLVTILTHAWFMFKVLGKDLRIPKEKKKEVKILLEGEWNIFANHLGNYFNEEKKQYLWAANKFV